MIMPNHTPLPLPNFFNKKRPPNLKLTPRNNSSTSINFSEAPSLPDTISTCTTPKVKDFLATSSLDNIKNLITYNSKKPIKNGQNGIVKTVTLSLSLKNETRTLVEKQGGSSVNREIKITNAIKTTTSSNFPYHLFALPIHQESSQITNTLYTCYRALGDLQTNIGYIQQKLQLEDSSAFSYIFQVFHQLTIALDALHNSDFKDEEGNIHQGIVHNDIKPDNIFLKIRSIELADFGCAYFKNTSAPQYATFLFSAPELWTNENFCQQVILNSDKSDIWSLGASLMYLLSNELMAPSLEKLSELDKILRYQEWAKTYSQQWKRLVAKIFTSVKNFSSEKDIVSLLKENINLKLHSNDPNNKKLILNNLALLMQAPIEVRPNSNELKNILDKLDFIIDGEPEIFISQLLNRNSSNVNTACSKLTNGYVSISDLNMNMPR